MVRCDVVVDVDDVRVEEVEVEEVEVEDVPVHVVDVRVVDVDVVEVNVEVVEVGGCQGCQALCRAMHFAEISTFLCNSFLTKIFSNGYHCGGGGGGGGGSKYK